MTARSDILARASALRAGFEARGAQTVEPPILQPAGELLDLYGEDIRSRAYVTSDALRGEQMLRPDFTVPVVQMHLSQGVTPARYTYAGEVFRRQESDPNRANEYVQVGFEVLGGEDPAVADAEVFAAISDALGAARLFPNLGDIGLLMAAVSGLETTDARKAALLRHLWRPARFADLLRRYSAPFSFDPPAPSAAPHVGLRSEGEIAARIKALSAEANAAPLATEQTDLLERLLAVRAPLPAALEALAPLAVEMPAIQSAVSLLEARGEALRSRGVDTSELIFDASYGRASMEYYDGFVFGFAAENRPDWPEVATGGRYDALTYRLGDGADLPAVGGVIRPDLLLSLEGAQ